jgi:hypothetical protein
MTNLPDLQQFLHARSLGLGANTSYEFFFAGQKVKER